MEGRSTHRDWAGASVAGAWKAGIGPGRFVLTGSWWPMSRRGDSVPAASSVEGYHPPRRGLGWQPSAADEPSRDAYSLRRTVTTLPNRETSVEAKTMSDRRSLAGTRVMVSPFCWNVLTVASSPGIPATTMSPLSAVA